MFLFAKNSTLCNYADDHAQCSIEKKNWSNNEQSSNRLS